MELSIPEGDFLNAFDHIGTYALDAHGKNALELFVIKTNANQFDYKYLEICLLEPVATYSVSRKVKEKYKSKPMELSKKAREKFLEYLRNNGELGELLIYCFLESHLKAPKILSKLELKTSTKMYVNGADGVHFLKTPAGNYQLIFGESKAIPNLTTALTEAFKSIHEFKTETNEAGDGKSGLPYEKSLISDHLEKETFSDSEKEFIEKIIYPKRDNDFDVDDAFGIFVGYEINILDEDRKLDNNVFRSKIKKEIEEAVKEKFQHILKKIEEYGLEGHNFYLYILPFTNLDESRKKIVKNILK